VLVLSRRLGESIVIGNEVVVRVIEVRGDQVKLGIEAPRSVQIHREEIHLELQAENEHAAGRASRTRNLVASLPPRPPEPQEPGGPERKAGTPGQRPVRPPRPSQD
jgi:carbon storage regulator